MGKGQKELIKIIGTILEPRRVVVMAMVHRLAICVPLAAVVEGASVLAKVGMARLVVLIATGTVQVDADVTLVNLLALLLIRLLK
jgi:hypothetical protein